MYAVITGCIHELSVTITGHLRLLDQREKGLFIMAAVLEILIPEAMVCSFAFTVKWPIMVAVCDSKAPQLMGRKQKGKKRRFLSIHPHALGAPSNALKPPP